MYERDIDTEKRQIDIYRERQMETERDRKLFQRGLTGEGEHLECEWYLPMGWGPNFKQNGQKKKNLSGYQHQTPSLSPSCRRSRRHCRPRGNLLLLLVC